MFRDHALAVGACTPAPLLTAPVRIALAVAVPLGVVLLLAAAFGARRGAGPPRISPIGSNRWWLLDSSALLATQPGVDPKAILAAWTHARAGRLAEALAAVDDALPPCETTELTPADLQLQALHHAAQGDMAWGSVALDSAFALYARAQPVLQSSAALAAAAASVNVRMAFVHWARGKGAQAVPLLRAALDARGEDWLMATAGPALAQFVLTVLPPPPTGWRRATVAPADGTIDDIDIDTSALLHAARERSTVRVIREWRIARRHPLGPLRILIADGSHVSVWSQAAPEASASLRLDAIAPTAELHFSVDRENCILQSDRILTAAAVLGRTRYRLFCNERACDVRRCGTRGEGTGRGTKERHAGGHGRARAGRGHGARHEREACGWARARARRF